MDSKNTAPQFGAQIASAVMPARVEEATSYAVRHDPAAPVSRLTIVLLVAATFGGGMAMIVPMSYSLALRIQELAPGRVDLLGLTLAIGSTAALVVAPLSGILSDRTRSRWGRRRPFTILGLFVGLASVPIMVFAGSPALLAVGWVASTIGWGTSVGSIGNFQADRLAPHQRGKVSGLTSLAMQVSPIVGILLVGLVPGRTALVFAIPAAFGGLAILCFIVGVREADSRQLHVEHPLTLRRLLASYLFRPGDSPDFAWNWLGRFLFFLGLTLTTSFTTFFFAQRLGLSVAEIAPVLALLSVASLGTSLVGALGVGSLSDRIGSRRPFVFAGVVVFSAGTAVSAFAYDLPMIIVGGLVSSLGIAAFGSVGQALTLDVIPHRETQAGRYLAIVAFSQKVPGVIAPIVAPLLLAVGGGANYTLLYLVSAVITLGGGAIIALKVRGVR